MPRVLQMVFCKYSKDFNYLFGNFSSHDHILTISSLFEVGRWFHCCCLVSEMLRLRLIATGVKSANLKREVFLFLRSCRWLFCCCCCCFAGQKRRFWKCAIENLRSLMAHQFHSVVFYDRKPNNNVVDAKLSWYCNQWLAKKIPCLVCTLSNHKRIISNSIVQLLIVRYWFWLVPSTDLPRAWFPKIYFNPRKSTWGDTSSTLFDKIWVFLPHAALSTASVAKAALMSSD